MKGMLKPMFFKKDSGGVSFVIAGLGNPDKKYNTTRHNAGFHGVDAIAKAHDASINRIKFKSLTAQVEIGGEKCLLLKPQTYMNLSGEAVDEALSFYKLPPERLIVLFDDISLNPGEIRIRRKGSHGGHNGIKNIVFMTGDENFPRVKLGVGAKPRPEYDLADWVLSSFTQNEQKLMEEAYSKCDDIVTLIIKGRIEEAMNKYSK